MEEVHDWQKVAEQRIIVKTCSPTTQDRVLKSLLKFPHKFALNIREKTQRERNTRKYKDCTIIFCGRCKKMLNKHRKGTV